MTNETSRRELLPGGVIRYATDKGSIELRHLAAGVIESSCEGRADVSMFEPMQADLEWMMRGAEQVEFFADLEGVVGYDSELRSLWMDWLKRNKSRVKAIHVFFHSALVAVAVQIFNLALGKVFVVHRSRAAFNAAARIALGSSPGRAQVG